MVMPFGKHRGVPLSALDEGYLAWLRTRDLREPLRSCVELEWERRMNAARQPRSYGHNDRNAVRVPPEDFGMFCELVQSGFRQLALRYHPDHAGRPEDMRRLNLLMETLREQLKRD